MLRFPRKASRSVAAVIVASALALGVTLPAAPARALRVGASEEAFRFDEFARA